MSERCWPNWITLPALAFALTCAAAAAWAAPNSAAQRTRPANHAADRHAIRALIQQYAQSIDAASPSLAAKVWWDSPRVSYVNPAVWVRGFAEIQRRVYDKLMGRTFTERHLVVHHVHINIKGDSAWAEFRWTFHARLQANGKPVSAQGVETQVYWKIMGRWRLVHVHYSRLPTTPTAK